MKVSDRLEMVIAAVQKVDCAADVGTDHGFVPVELVRRGIVKKAIAMDVRPGPLSRAAEHIRAAGLEKAIETRLSDGLSGLLAGEARTVVIAGLGGELMIRILDEGRHVWDSVEKWVLSPHTDLFKVRKWLWENGFTILKEDMVFETGKYYTVLVAERLSKGLWDGHTPDFLDCLCGRYLPQTGHPVFFRYIKAEEQKLERLIERLSGQTPSSLRAERRLSEARKELSLYRRIGESFRKTTQEAEDEMF